MTGDRLLVFFNEDKIGPVAVGAVEVLIPYDGLSDMLWDILLCYQADCACFESIVIPG